MKSTKTIRPELKKKKGNCIQKLDNHSQRQIKTTRQIKICSDKATPDISNIELQIKASISKANQVLKEVSQKFRPTLHKNQDEAIYQLRLIQEEVRRKNKVIKAAELEIKNIKNGQVDIQNMSNDSWFSVLINNQASYVRKILGINLQKRQKLQQNKKRIGEIQQKYISKCLQQANQALSFQQFKEIYISGKRVAKRNQKSERQNCFENRLKTASFGECKQTQQHLKSTGPNSNEATISQNWKLKEVANKKNVAQAALKAAKKKHIMQMNTYRSKLQFLSDQFEELEEKFIKKMKQLKIAQSKFSSTRNKPMAGPSRSLKNIKTQ